MRRITPLLSLVVLMLLPVAHAAADVSVTGDGDGIDTRVTKPGTGTGGSSGPLRHRGRGPSSPPPSRIVRSELRWDDGTAQTCVRLGEQPGDPNSRAAQDAEQRAQWLVGRFPICPGANAELRPSAAVVALMMWQQRTPLSVPSGTIRPGRAITGKEAFLEIGGPSTGHWHFEVFGYSIDISAASTYDVDWGDGTSTTGITSRGGPWPDGDIRHVWTTTCSCTITITQRWYGTWTIGDGGRPIPGVMVTRGTIRDFPVGQIQAVRQR